MKNNPLLEGLPPELTEKLNKDKKESTMGSPLGSVPSAEKEPETKPEENISSEGLPGLEAPTSNPLSGSLPDSGSKESVNPLAGVSGSPLEKMASPFPSSTGKSSNYSLDFGEEGPPAELKELVESKTVEEMTQAELRQVYLKIKGTPSKHLYSASEINDIDKIGKPREFGKYSESLFIGDHVHKAMEVKGDNLHQLVAVEDSLGEKPEAPVFDLTKGELDILTLLADGVSARRAVREIRNNKVTKDVSDDLLDELGEVTADDAPLPKELVALDKLVDKDTAKIKPGMIKEMEEYLKKLSFYESRRAKLIAGDKIVIDDLPYRTSSAIKVLEAIKKSYNGLKDSACGDLYENGFTGRGEKLTEHVVLWKHTLPSGKEVNCKSMLDRVVIDDVNKVVSVLDIKTHSRHKYQFIYESYLGYSYFRSMSFYTEAIKYMLTQKGYNAEEYNIRVALLPVSTKTGEAGSHFDYVEMGNIDLHCGKEGGFLKPVGSKYDSQARVQIFLDNVQYKFLESGGLIHSHARDLYKSGWNYIIEDYEKRLSSSIIPGS